MRLSATRKRSAGPGYFAALEFLYPRFSRISKTGLPIEQFLKWFPGVKRWQVETVLNHEVKALAGSVDS